ncbi:MAG: ScpA family protein [Rhodospirillales bacterium]
MNEQPEDLIGEIEFEEDHPENAGEGAFIVDLDGFEGPIDMLLAMARHQKVDLAKISILQLADQYLMFVQHARRRNLELAADYLVMAAWLAYLKSKLLLPDLDAQEEPTGEEMAAALTFQLQRLEAMQNAGAKIVKLPQFRQAFFGRGNPERFRAVTKTVIDATLYDLLKAYGDMDRHKNSLQSLHIEPVNLYTVEDAIKRFERLLGTFPDWESLWRFLPRDLQSGLKSRSAMATTFTACLELAKQGRLRIRQNQTFGPIFLRAQSGAPSGPVATQEHNDR